MLANEIEFVIGSNFPLYDLFTLGTTLRSLCAFVYVTADRAQGQTPQSFKLSLILEAHEKAKSGDIPNVTDDAKLVISMGKDVHLVEGSKQNFKITTFDDLMLLKALLKIGKTEVL